MMKFSMPGSPFQKIWQVYEPMETQVRLANGKTYPYITPDGEMVCHTCFAKGHKIRHVLHENASLELQLWFSSLVNELL